MKNIIILIAVFLGLIITLNSLDTDKKTNQEKTPEAKEQKSLIVNKQTENKPSEEEFILPPLPENSGDVEVIEIKTEEIELPPLLSEAEKPRKQKVIVDTFTEEKSPSEQIAELREQLRKGTPSFLPKTEVVLKKSNDYLPPAPEPREDNYEAPDVEESETYFYEGRIITRAEYLRLNINEEKPSNVYQENEDDYSLNNLDATLEELAPEPVRKVKKKKSSKSDIPDLNDLFK
ncbi:hypothetical protein ALC152_05260 [Arcobacter sp. 15-2]|uniref:hypothetical protein n=1 Tax=Arcobacter sp. 15-2 TaxID=3374109 RepID=UPI00399CC3CA